MVVSGSQNYAPQEPSYYIQSIPRSFNVSEQFKLTRKEYLFSVLVKEKFRN